MVNIENLISNKAFKGWFGKKRKQTDKNIEEIAEELLEITSKEEIIEQVRESTKRFKRNQILYGICFVTNFIVIPYFTWNALKSNDDVMYLASSFTMAVVASCLGAGMGTLEARKYLYQGIEEYISKK